MLYFILDRKFKKLNTLKFESVEISFGNKSKISFTKNDLNFYVEGRNRNQESQFYQILRDKIQKEQVTKFKKIILDKKSHEQDKRLAIANELQKINIKISAPTKFIYDNVTKFVEEYEVINFQKILDVLDTNITSKILYFPTYRRIESQIDSLKIKRNLHQQGLFWEEEEKCSLSL